MAQSWCGEQKNKEDRKIEDIQLNIDKLDKKFDELLKQWDANKLQKWLDSNV